MRLVALGNVGAMMKFMVVDDSHIVRERSKEMLSEVPTVNTVNEVKRPTRGENFYFVHIMTGALWTGTDLFYGFVLGPIMRKMEPVIRVALFRRLAPRMAFLMPAAVSQQSK